MTYEWRVTTDEEKASKRCRMLRCGAQPVVAAFNRGRYNWATGRHSDSWWCYCAEHLYGRTVVDGQVLYGWRAGRCPDGGTCHHGCDRVCWRVLHDEPIAGIYQAESWPVDHVQWAERVNDLGEEEQAW